MFAGFVKDQRHVNGVDIAYRLGGSGPGLLLLRTRLPNSWRSISPWSPPTCAATATAPDRLPMNNTVIIQNAKWPGTTSS
ncbi:hypothetical protein [Pseudomonas sp. Irchel s3a10]|uniref:hypothetical protein n=1 Tax=Pseudomonas sp. Irchel s3a10 TaxID=2009045 RepID=UPI003531AA42